MAEQPITESANTSSTATESVEPKGELFGDLSPEETPTQIESLCMNCEKTGLTTLLLTKIPFFKEIVLMAFQCPHCGYRNNEIQSAGEIQEKGVHYTLKITDPKDLNRQVVKSESATITIPELDFEIPAITQRGLLNTIEGFLMTSADALKAGQEQREQDNPEIAAKVKAFIEKLESYARGEVLPFSFVLDDPAGNSYVENPHAPKEDSNLVSVHYARTMPQNHSLGLYPDEKQESGETPEDTTKKLAAETKPDDLRGEVMTFPSVCPSCHTDVEVRMCMINIPYFKDIVMMASACDKCGYKSSEVKAGGAIPPKGKKITLKVTSTEDLTRDILKSETAQVDIPEISLELAPGTLGGKFTTLEGLLDLIKSELSNNPFIKGDSAQSDQKSQFQDFLSSLQDLLDMKREWTIVITDPVANSYIQNLYAPDPDPNLTIEEYERTWHESEELGLNDIKTEEY